MRGRKELICYGSENILAMNHYFQVNSIIHFIYYSIY